MKKYLFISILFIAPVSLFAVTLKTFVQNAITNVAYVSVSLIVALAVLAFFVGVIKFLYASRNGVETGMTEGKQTMMWGIISIFVIISVFGIIQLAQGITGTNVTDINMPTLNGDMFMQQAGFQTNNSSLGGGK